MNNENVNEKQFGNPVVVNGMVFVGPTKWTTVPTSALVYGFSVCTVAKGDDWRTALWIHGQRDEVAFYVLEEWEVFRLASLLDAAWLDSMDRSLGAVRTMCTEAGDTFCVSLDVNDYSVELTVGQSFITLDSNCISAASELRSVSNNAACYSTH